MRRVLLKAIAVIVVLAAIAAAGGYHYLRRSLPQIDGTRDRRRSLGADRNHS